MGRVHAKVVSEKFNGLDERQKRDMVWVILNGELGEDAQFVTLVIAYGTDELWRSLASGRPGARRGLAAGYHG